MAQRYRSSRSRAARGSRRPAGGSNGHGRRSSGRAPTRRGGNGPAIVATLAVVVVIVLVVVIGSGKEDKGRVRNANPTPSTTASTTSQPEQPKQPQRPPPPDLPPGVKAEAKRLADEYEEKAKEAIAIYEKAMGAHQTGDDDTWQSKLEEASLIYAEINDGWNELIFSIPTTDEWDDPDEIANYHMPREQERIMRLLKLRKDIDKQRNLDQR